MKALTLHRGTLIIVGIFSILQFVLLTCYYDDLEVTGDAVEYVKNAIYHSGIGLLYPTSFNNQDIYIQSPGYVNLLALMQTVFGSFRVILVFKVFFNLAIIYEIYYLAKHFFSNRVADISVILYCLMPVNVFSSINFYNEIDYLFLSLTAFCLCINNKKIFLPICGGFLFAYAHTIRPLEIVLLLCLFIVYFLKKVNAKAYFAVLVPYILFLSMFGFYCKAQTGVFITTSTVTGHNLVFMAHEKANGGQNHVIGLHSDPHQIGYVDPNLHFSQKDSIRKAKSLEWIKEHPLHYIKSYLRGATLIMFRNDSWSIPKLSPYDDINEVMKMPNPQKAHLVLYIRQFCFSLVYYITLFLFGFSVIRNRKEIFGPKGIFVLIPLLTVAGTALLGTEPRYHYPFMFAIIIWAAYGVGNLRRKRIG